MSRRVKEFVDIENHSSLDDLIEKLLELRASLPEEAEAELRLRGDDVFGHRITISYLRNQTKDEAECEKRYAEAAKEAEESGGPKGKEPTRYGDWENHGICWDF